MIYVIDHIKKEVRPCANARTALNVVHIKYSLALKNNDDVNIAILKGSEYTNELQNLDRYVFLQPTP